MDEEKISETPLHLQVLSSHGLSVTHMVDSSDQPSPMSSLFDVLTLVLCLSQSIN